MPNSFNCLGLPVFTQSGFYLGKVIGIEVDAAASQVIYYQIKKIPFWYFGSRFECLVSPRQVVSLNQDRMIVQDNVNKSPDLKIRPVIEPSC